MVMMTHAKLHFNQWTLTLIFGIRASAERLKRPGLIGLRDSKVKATKDHYKKFQCKIAAFLVKSSTVISQSNYERKQ